MTAREDALLQRRARPSLGTLVSIEADCAGLPQAHVLDAITEAFAVVEAVDRAMSAHRHDSDLARLAQAHAGTEVPVSRHTCAVLRAAQQWTRLSSGAFDPVRAGRQLARRGMRPGIATLDDAPGSLAALEFRGDGIVVPDGPLQLDLGGIAKGYAVDQAIEALRSRGVAGALVNAGGDLRTFGPRAWRIDLRHPAVQSFARPLVALKDGAVATSVRSGDFVPKRRAARAWHCASVQARDCITADALTKWALDAAEPGLLLRAAVRRSGARLMRW